MIRPLLLGFLLLAACGKVAGPDIQVSDAWSRATAADQTSAAVYATIRNEGATSDQLLAVSTDRASQAMLHEGSMENGVARMRMVERVELAPGEAVQLEPGGAHVMLMGVAEPLNAGQRFTLRLRFEKSGERTVPVTVVAAGER
jgi:periplasmic copper chaperone A